MNKTLVIFGPTSTGKTDLALSLAKKFNGELISCDSRQVYKGLDIGTGKLPSGSWSPTRHSRFGDGAKMEGGRWKKGEGFWEIRGISKARVGALKVWMYDVVDPKRQYTVAHYVKDANRVIDGIIKRGRLPVVVGGTGLYLKALLEGLSNLAVPVDQRFRNELSTLSLEELQRKLQETSPQKWKKMNSSDRQNSRRLIRAIEIVDLSETEDINNINATAVALMLRAGKAKLRNDILKIGLTAPREILYQRIDERVVSRIDQGMISEAINLHKSGLSFKRMRQLGLEYGILADYLEGEITGEQNLIEVLQGKIHGYARRQLTWFKKEKDVNWFDITAGNFPDKVEKVITRWYHDYDATENRHFP